MSTMQEGFGPTFGWGCLGKGEKWETTEPTRDLQKEGVMS